MPHKRITSCMLVYRLAIMRPRPMTITIQIPDELAAAIAAPGQDLSRAALEAIALNSAIQPRGTPEPGHQIEPSSSQSQAQERPVTHGIGR